MVYINKKIKRSKKEKLKFSSTIVRIFGKISTSK